VEIQTTSRRESMACINELRHRVPRVPSLAHQVSRLVI